MGTIFVDQTVMYTDSNQRVVLTDVGKGEDVSMPQRCIGGVEGISQFIINLGARWGRVVSLTPRPL